jgi:hypothetical protein
MGVTPFPTYPQGPAEMPEPAGRNPDWVGIAVGATFLAGALLLLSGKKKAGLVVSGAALGLTVLDQQDTVKMWWNALPKYLDDAQHLLDQAQGTIDDLAAKREKLRSMFNR